MARCAHPYALLSFADPASRVLCTKCKLTLPPPAAFKIRPAPADLVTPVREFLTMLKSAENAAAQVNPRHELQLILAMSDALHAIDAQEAQQK